ncbi:MAG: 4-phosphoerythronate dehydrogenase PdxB [Tannerellaceae bacterium]|nr:4-phosphoerythronate dehydrogenase PdxB [Tannerellaceae bacterium]
MLIIADQTIPYLQGVLEPYADVRYLPSSGFTPENIQGAEVLIVRSIDICNRRLLEGSKVKLITTATIGYDHIDTHFCREAGITWKNAPGCNAASVGQYIFSSLLYVALKEGISLKNKTIGIVGVGHVGKEVEKLCEGYGMRILLNDPPRVEKEGSTNFVSLEEIAAEADIITFHTPLTKEGRYPTFHLANDVFFDSCRKKPWFINASRGAVHDTATVLKAHQKKQITNIILDCWENEPFINQELLKATLLATPHIAGFSADGKSNTTRMCLEYINDIYNLGIPNLKEIKPLPPQNPIIDLNKYNDYRLERAFLETYNPVFTDTLLRTEPAKFEWFRSHYPNPREPKAYTLVNATREEKRIATTLGFSVSL